jgi:hypothetical protein
MIANSRTIEIPQFVVSPASNDDALINALMYALPLVRKGRELWEGVKMVVSEDGKLAVTAHNHDIGKPLSKTSLANVLLNVSSFTTWHEVRET